MRGKYFVPMRSVSDRLANIRNSIVSAETQIDQDCVQAESSQLPRERHAVGELIMRISADARHRTGPAQLKAGFRDRSSNSIVVVATRLRRVWIE